MAISELTLGIVGTVSGPIGALTGGISLWRQQRRDRVRVQVVPFIFHKFRGTDAHGRRLSIERECTTTAATDEPDDVKVVKLRIVNKGAFPMTIEQVGFRVRRPRGPDKGARLFFTNPTFGPRRIEPRDSVTHWFAQHVQESESWPRVTCAFATTATGETFTGTNAAIRAFVRAAASRQAS